MICRFRLLVAAAPLKNLDLVPVRILHEEEARQRRALELEFLQRCRAEAKGFEPGVLCLQIADRKCQMPISVAEHVGLRPTVIDCQFQFELAFRVTQVDEREAFKRQSLRHPEAERLVVECEGALLVEHPDHRMNGLGHGKEPLQSRSPHLLRQRGPYINQPILEITGRSTERKDVEGCRWRPPATQQKAFPGGNRGRQVREEETLTARLQHPWNGIVTRMRRSTTPVVSNPKKSVRARIMAQSRKIDACQGSRTAFPKEH